MLITTHTGNANIVNLPRAPDNIGLHGLFRKQAHEHLTGGRSLFFEGDEAAYVFEVLEGVLRILRMVADGRRVITGFLYPGDIVGLSLGGRYLYSAEAVSTVTVRRVARRQFDFVVANNDRLRPQVFALVSDEMAAAQAQMVLLSCKSAEERLCSFLLSTFRQVGPCGQDPATFELPMGRGDIADYLGLTIETVSRTFTKLIARGIIRIDSISARHKITITRPGKLAQFAGGCEDHEDAPRLSSVRGGRQGCSTHADRQW